MSPNSCFKSPPPNLDVSLLSGKLIVVEGPDSSGRSTHIGMLARWLEEQGYAVVEVGLKRSTLVSTELDKAMKGNVLSPRTMSLFYATDFYDQMENIIVPALHAGFIVLADRYIFTLMARDIVRGADQGWMESLYSRALVPDAVFFLKVPPETLAVRTLKDNSRLDYWESGIDMALSQDWYDCFIEYQRRMDQVFRKLAKQYEFRMLNGYRPKGAIHSELKQQVKKILEKSEGPGSLKKTD
jgi:dTMP kinase